MKHDTITGSATLLTLSLSLALGCAPVDGEVGDVIQALTGSAPSAPTSQGVVGPYGSNIWSVGGGTNRWSNVRLADVDGNGYDDLCGSYGDSWGCSLRLSNTWFEGFIEARDVRSFTSSTVRLADINGDGRADVCGRDYSGFRCLLSTGAAFVAPRNAAGALFTYVSDMSNTNGWNRPEYESTVMVGRVWFFTGLDVCARGTAGVICHYNIGEQGMVQGPTIREFSDAAGWNREEHYATLAMADVNGDGYMDICGRGGDGILCAVNDPAHNTFRPATRWTAQFSNLAGWSDPKYYRSIRFADVNGDGRADVCGRGGGGVYCGLSDGTGGFVGAENLVVPAMSDVAGFSAGAYPASLMLVDYDNDVRADVCMVGPYRYTTSTGATGVRDELYCARSRGGTQPSFEVTFRRTDGSGIVGVVAPGAIRTQSRGFCWVDALRDLRCTNAW